MSKYNVIDIEINSGVITTAFHSTTPTIKAFLAGISVIDTFNVVGWNFDRVHLTHGSEENGSGYAFIRQY